MTDQAISCPACGRKIPLTRALRSEIEASVRQRFDQMLQQRERDLRAEYDRRVEDSLKRVQKDAAKKAERKVAQELAGLKSQLKDQAVDLEEARQLELSMRKRERDLERRQQDLELTVARQLDKERGRIIEDTQSVTFNVSGMYGDLQALVPALPSIALLELPEAEMDAEREGLLPAQ